MIHESLQVDCYIYSNYFHFKLSVLCFRHIFSQLKCRFFHQRQGVMEVHISSQNSREFLSQHSSVKFATKCANSVFFLMNKQWLLYITDNQGNISHRNISWYYLLWNYILSSSVILNIQKQQQPILWRDLFSASQNVFSHLRVYCMWSVVNNIVLGHDYSIHSKKFVVFSCYLLRFFQIFLHSSMWSLHVSSSHLGSLWISPFNILQTTYPKFLALSPLCS